MKQYFTHIWLTTAISFTIISSAVITPTAHGAEARNQPTRAQILTALWLMSPNYQQYLCNKYIIRKESNYRTDARNGSHYGLAQGRSRYLATATYTQQLAWYFRYIGARYSGDGCRAKEHHLKHNWY